MDWKMPFEPAFATRGSLTASKRMAQAAHARQRRCGTDSRAQTESRHIGIDILRLLRRDGIALMPDADGAIVLQFAVEGRPGGKMLTFAVMGIGEQLLQAFPILQQQRDTA